MSNMSYCRFRNTATDLEDCLEHFDEELSPEEHRSRLKIIRLCREVAECYPTDDDVKDLPVENLDDDDDEEDD
jgi:hypothetical protein